ncbi:uncharacterized protein LOC119557018 [Drosophila subpulchrella]|uniref:uncharacterized protein LOC119557018 n=1 Tax=Drosophila subpulchrella TaxID=1486046 RepID=UPI0018A13A54|nr:uncharacterized protein LOC119557018 [Drosophila subpulchrella]XP_037725483.1 uncharacterized protein LOC119557018 [Drosophila subpulchrella]
MSEQNDEQFVRCSHCLKEVRCTQYDTGSLFRHLEVEHSDLFADASSKIRYVHRLLASARGSSGSGGSMSQSSKILNPLDSHTADGLEHAKVKKRISGDPATRKSPTPTINLAARKAQPGPCSQAHATRKPKDNPCGTPKDPSKNKNNSYPKTKDPSGPATKTLPCPKPWNAPCPCVEEEMKILRQMTFKASVNKWRAYEGNLFCPACCYKRRPVVKSASELNSGCCSWLKCLFPCLSRPDERQYLFCAQCKTFLGIYNRGTNSLKPNKEYA